MNKAKEDLSVDNRKYKEKKRQSKYNHQDF